MEETKTAVAAKNWGIEPGRTPPPKQSRPPAAVKPEIALVTLMRGVCKAGVTLQTLWYPAIAAKEKVVTIPKNTGSGHKTPKPTNEDKPIPLIIAFFKVELKVSYFTTSFFSSLGFFFTASN
jgi:hypothetical protein